MHGGGFYHVKKYKVAPPVLPDHLAWFKWEAYTTWLSGFALMVVLYYFNANAYLIDPSVADLSSWEAVGISIALLVVAWVVYDVLCRLLLPRGRNGEIALWVLILVLTTLAAWGCGELFQPRAAFLQVGAMLGTIMAGNVFFNIIPAHWELINAKKAGREPDPTPGIIAEEALGPQQLLHAAGAVHDARRALRVRLRRRARLARPDRDHAARRPDAGVLQPAPPGPHDLGHSRRSASSASSCSPGRSSRTTPGVTAPRRPSPSRRWRR